MEDVQQYQYTPLLEPDAFRIIVIHPALSIESPLSCSLIHSNLFRSLSYVWGDANNRKTVSVEEKPLLVTASLDSALRHLQDRKKDVMIWADGICINPSDYEEKNTQVNLMALIYEVASHIIIFLGETTPEGDKIFELLLPPISSLLKKQIKPMRLSNVRVSHDSDAFDLESKEDMESKIHDLIRHVLDMPWFRRIWILQELVLSVDPWVQVGNHRLKGTISRVSFSNPILSITLHGSSLQITTFWPTCACYAKVLHRGLRRAPTHAIICFRFFTRVVDMESPIQEICCMDILPCLQTSQKARTQKLKD
ncbi:hypothetical protein QC760_008788 [Botrytis cinerea]